MIKNISIPEKAIRPSNIGSDANYGVGCRTGTLAGKFLVASPSLSMQDSCFSRSVVYICTHNESGAMGIITNYVVENVTIDDVMEQVNIENNARHGSPVYFGGPVEGNRGFIIHSDDVMVGGVISKLDGIAVTSNAEILQVIADGKGPKHYLLALGYSGWTAGQLEAEMESGSWIVVSPTKQLLFDTHNEMKWSLAIASLGFDVGNFSNVVGHA